MTYGDGPTSINLLTADGRWARLTFENLDAIRVCRGEYSPYPGWGDHWKPGDTYYWVSIVDNSQWLDERYQYEKVHYGDSYQFGGDVDEMLSEFSHYLFEFHDQYVEALAAGIWIETSDTPLGSGAPGPEHPLLDLPRSAISHRLEAHGISCQLRTNPKTRDHLIEDANLCSQKVFQYAAELDGSDSVSWTLTTRVRDGKVRSFLRSYFGKAEHTYDGIPDEAEIRPHVEKWLGQVRERRNEMGKS